jgi:hypothetical protein
MAMVSATLCTPGGCCAGCSGCAATILPHRTARMHRTHSRCHAPPRSFTTQHERSRHAMRAPQAAPPMALSSGEGATVPAPAEPVIPKDSLPRVPPGQGPILVGCQHADACPRSLELQQLPPPVLQAAVIARARGRTAAGRGGGLPPPGSPHAAQTAP